MSAMRVGLIGLGVISRYYAAAIAKDPGLHLRGVCDLDERRTRPLSGPGVTATADYRELLADASIDAVVVNLPNDLHLEACRAALEAGKHVCCEKPLTISPGDADALMERAGGAGRTLFTAFHRRYNDNVVALRRRLAVGPPETISVRYWERIEDHCGSDSWYLDPRSCGGGCLADNGPNAIDLVLLLAPGPAEIVSARVERDGRAVDRRAEITLRAGGALASISLDWDHPGERKDVRVRHRDGRSDTADMLAGHREFKSSLFHEYEALLADFHAHCRAGRSNPNGPAVVRLVEDAYRAAAAVAAP
jgi:predicted dehydrogenase